MQDSKFKIDSLTAEIVGDMGSVGVMGVIFTAIIFESEGRGQFLILEEQMVALTKFTPDGTYLAYFPFAGLGWQQQMVALSPENHF